MPKYNYYTQHQLSFEKIIILQYTKEQCNTQILKSDLYTVSCSKTETYIICQFHCFYWIYIDSLIRKLLK